MKKIATILSLFLALLLIGCVALAEGDFAGIGVVHTQFGDVSGVIGEREDVTVFKGVPYAAPPVGDLRWAEPVDPEPWTDVLACDTYAPAAMQPPYTAFMMRPGSDFYPLGAPPQSEDCLYLNVTTPATSADEKLPVVVWFHGGGLSHGYSWQVPFDGEGLASKGVIVVTVGHRLGMMGFISLPQLTEASGYGASGNYGLMDCVKSVEWVYDNIAAFGGDPERIMVFGQSGGGAKTVATVAAPQTQGKIARFATHSSFGIFNGSGSNMGMTTLAENEEAGLALLDELGVSRDATLEELRAIPAETIYAAGGAAGGAMVIDGKYVTGQRTDFYLGEGNLNGIEMIAGWVFGEKGSYEATTAAELFAKIRETYGDELVDKYDLENTMPITDTNVGYYNLALKQDEALDEIRLYAKIKAERNENSPSYIFSFGRVTPNKNLGWHSGELWYLFNNLGYSFEGLDAEWQPAWEVYDYMVAEATSDYWTNFAKTGDPNGKGLVEWPAADADSSAYQYIDVVSTSFEELSSFDQMVIEYYMNQYGLGE